MAIKITISDKVGIKVKGSIQNEAGAAQPFDFNLICQRLDADQIALRLKDDSERSLIDFMLDVVEDWSGVRSDDDKPLPFSADNYRALCKIPGVALIAFRTYLADVGAKEKN
jgi:hypothetical protein